MLQHVKIDADDYAGGLSTDDQNCCQMSRFSGALIDFAGIRIYRFEAVIRLLVWNDNQVRA